MKKSLLIFCFVISAILQISAKQIVVSKDGTGDFQTIQEAINAVQDGESSRIVIFVKNGVYSEKVIIPSSKQNVTLTGESAEKTIITFNDYNPKVKGNDTVTTWSSYTFAVDAEGFIAENITFENSAGPVGQAVAVRIIADKVIFRNCRFLGNQDTLFAHGIGRIYLVNCYIEGTTDFIFGSAIALFESCHIHSKKDSYITAASTPKGNTFGYVFRNCTLTADSAVTKVFLGRPWRPFARTVFLHCRLGNHIRTEGWDNWRNPENEKTAFYAEYQSSGPGANPLGRVHWAKQLTKEEADQYTPEEIFARNSVPIPVVGAWNPADK